MTRRFPSVRPLMLRAATAWTCWIFVSAAATLAAQESSAPRAAGDSASWLDAAPSARVASWDPARAEGARADRVQEYRAEDVYLATYLSADANHCYQPVRFADGKSCIGLEWDARRQLRRVGIQFAEEDVPPDIEQSQVEFWLGGTLWQGKWTALPGRIIPETERQWTFELPTPEKLAVMKVRWIFPATSRPPAVTRLSATTLSTLATTDLLLRAPRAESGSRGEIKIINGWIKDGDRWTTHLSWDLASALPLTIRSTLPSENVYAKSDATVLLFTLPDAAFGVAVSDILERGPVWVPRGGLYAAKAGAESFEQYARRIAPQQTILDRVRHLPDQTREQAMRETHYIPHQDEGAMLLSLACDNNKFIAYRDGRIGYAENYVKERPFAPPPCMYYMTPRYGLQRIAHKQDWGQLGIDTAAHAGTAQPMALRIGDKQYARGLGHHANGEISVALQGKYDRFDAEVGIQEQSNKRAGSVVFRVLVDGRERFTSGVMRAADPPRAVSVPLAGAQRLLLTATDTADGIACDMADWAEARLTPQGGAVPVSLSDLAKETPPLQRHLAEGWLPAPVSETEVGGLRYAQRTFVVPLEKENLSSAPRWLNAAPLAVAEVTIENRQAQPQEASVSLTFEPTNADASLTIAPSPARSTVESQGRLWAVIDSSELDAAKVQSEDRTWTIAAQIPPQSSRRLYAYLPAWPTGLDRQAEIAGGQRLFTRFRDYWQAVMAGGMKVTLPDPWLTNVIRANQAHLFIAARHEDAGARVVPWIASLTYRHAVDSEGHSPLRAMIDFGHDEFARRAFEFYFANIQPEGFMTTGYTVVGTGWDLWTLAEYLELSGDNAWFQRVAPQPLRMCRWIMDERLKTAQPQPDGRKLPEYGLMPPGVLADWGNYAYYFFANAHYQRALAEMGKVLSERKMPEGEVLATAAARYREDVLRAFRHASSNAPVVPLRDGTWVAYAPTSVYTPGTIGDFFPGEDAARSWAYDVELGAHHLAALGVMDPTAPATDDMLNYLEDVQFLMDGWRGYPASMSEADWFNMGGFGKMQPYYTRNAEIYALRDDVKPFLRSYFNAMASLIDGEVLSFYEHFMPTCINKTHETGYFLHQSRLMLVMERGDELWLAPFIPAAWLEDGKTVEVADAPTQFGHLSYRIDAHTAGGYVEVQLTPPTRNSPKEVVIRLRHPLGKEIASARAEDGTAVTIDAERQLIRLKPRQPVKVRVDYAAEPTRQQ